MNTEEVKALFLLSGFKVEKIKHLVNGYHFGPDDDRFYDEKPHPVWYFVKTEIGWIVFGHRKRVWNIDWSDTAVRAIVTTDEVTKDSILVHAWSTEKALEYLKELKRISIVLGV